MTSHPVLVVGIGRAGCDILAEMDEFVSREGVADRFQLFAIDSSSRDLQTFAPESATTYELTTDSDAPNRDFGSVHYLQGDHNFVPDAGTSRQRPLGRYLVDSAADSAHLSEALTEQITTLAENCSATSEPLQVWIVNSLGGGTGSGAFPFISMLLQQCRQEVAKTVEIFGIGSLPSLNRIEERIEAPEGEPAHYANAYTALAELRRLMDLDGDTTYPIEIGIDASPATIRSESLSVQENPFDGYWLLGFNETDQFDATDVSRTNSLGAQLVYYLGSTDSDEWFRQGHLYSIAGVSVEAPTEQLKQYHTLNQELADLDDELGTLRKQRESLTKSVEYIDFLLHAGTHGPVNGDEPNQSSPAETLGGPREEIKSQCEDIVSGISTTSNPNTSRMEIFEKQVQDLMEQHEGQIPENVPTELAIRLLCASSLRDQIREKIVTHPLRGYLQKLQRKWSIEDISEPPEPELTVDEESEMGSFEEWRARLLDELQGRVEDLHVRMDDSLLPGFISGPRQQLSKLETDLERADRFRREYENLRDFESVLTNEIKNSRYQLKEERSRLEEKAEDKQEEWETTQQRWSSLSQQQSQLAASMREELTQEGRLSVPLQFEERPIDSELHSSNFTTLCSKEVLSEQDLRQSIETAMTLLEEPVEDLAESHFGKTSGKLGVIASDSDHSLIEEILLEADDSVDSLQRELYYQFTGVDDLVNGKQHCSLSLLGFYSPISLDYTSEFETIHDCYTDPEADVSSLLGSISDSDLEKRFAYPDLLQ
ncbi:MULTISPECIES: tubulin-like doman-containing protein [Halolamina]|uniref:Tubulin like n=1 Tax=Halolamina pelagica TaxID=699431 RepID=A0A1I5UMP4_9EURY|nr:MULTISPECIES: tubulin-like doman-containing protein [Halolamina]NHX37608.1 hypothetical protein [Halolamina sp. R1-12]SFP96468.1 Tubulin like [Halolamina pelagica]